ncbi:MAG: SoxR reducing system RseC family protein [Gammaproteobacteria bacterium]|nr:SoxR reducing system RseC family protein [Gammaproteobacteria bacterium]
MRNDDRLEVVGTVTAADEVSLGVSSGCPRCDRGEGCGQGAWFAARSRTWRLSVPTGAAQVASTVRLTLPATRLLHAAALAYGLPLLGLVTGAVLGQLLGGEFPAVSGSIIGLLAGFALARRLAVRAAARLQPTLCPDASR